MVANNPFPIKELRQMKPKPIKGLDIKTGTIEFEGRRGFPWNDSKFNVLINICEELNSSNNIVLVKDKLNKLNVVYNSVEPNRFFSKIKYDVSNLSTSEPHHLAVTWSQANKELKLYLDGKPIRTKKIK